MDILKEQNLLGTSNSLLLGSRNDEKLRSTKDRTGKILRGEYNEKKCKNDREMNYWCYLDNTGSVYVGDEQVSMPCTLGPGEVTAESPHMYFRRWG